MSVRPGERGFSLVEMAVVVVLLGILAATARVSVVGINTMRRDLAIRQLMSHLRLAQVWAVERHSLVWVSFSPATEQYTLYLEDPASPGLAGRKVARDPLTQGPFTVTLGDASTPSVLLVSASIAGTLELRFDKFGFPAGMNGEVMAADGTVVLSSDGVPRTMTIAPETGRVLMQ